MKYINIEIKAKSNNHERIREFLKFRNATNTSNFLVFQNQISFLYRAVTYF